ncbi:unnamed protein product [Tenebrio molitor]|nr:unnamed protein product [Tenebrio molitor]
MIELNSIFSSGVRSLQFSLGIYIIESSGFARSDNDFFSAVRAPKVQVNFYRFFYKKNCLFELCFKHFFPRFYTSSNSSILKNFKFTMILRRNKAVF